MKENNPYILEASNITKRFENVVANDDVSLNLKEGEVLALFGENGSGKTTLINVLSGLYVPEEGTIKIKNKNVSINSTTDAIKNGIGTVHQHFKLVKSFDGIENIMMYDCPNVIMNRDDVHKKADELCKKYGFKLDLNKKVGELSVSQKQELEILKILFTKAEILIFDEPTAVLTPNETATFLNIIKIMQAEGKSIIFISHKLDEVFNVSNRIQVLRKGKHITTLNTKNTTKKELTELMVGKSIDLSVNKVEPHYDEILLDVNNLTYYNEEGVKKLSNFNLKIFKGEIFGIAGIADSGQSELCACISGLKNYSQGKILYYGSDKQEPLNIKNLSSKEINKLGISLGFIPEDRMELGLVGDFNIVENILVRSYKDGSIPHIIDKKEAFANTSKIIEELEVDNHNFKTKVKDLSGGNAQKILLGRELLTSPSLLLSVYPARGLDIQTTNKIFKKFEDMKKNNCSVLFIGEDLDALLSIADRILVMYNGTANYLTKSRETNKEEIGFYMVNKNQENAG